MAILHCKRSRNGRTLSTATCPLWLVIPQSRHQSWTGRFIHSPHHVIMSTKYCVCVCVCVCLFRSDFARATSEGTSRLGTCRLKSSRTIVFSSLGVCLSFCLSVCLSVCSSGLERTRIDEHCMWPEMSNHHQSVSADGRASARGFTAIQQKNKETRLKVKRVAKRRHGDKRWCWALVCQT